MPRSSVLVLVVLLTASQVLVGQAVEFGGGAVAAWRHLDRTPGGGADGQLQLVRPVLMGRVRLTGGLGLRGTANLEGLTMPNGEPWLGGWGEGFVDRRHPHTYVHELVLEAIRRGRCGRARCAVGAFLGKGFVPFGSDDPMSRPLLRFPMNHHLAQVLERAVLGGQAGFGALTIEAALFNGDEPERPGQWPRVGNRFGDSRAVRLTIEPGRGLALSASAAAVASPEHRAGAGGRQDKVHLGARLEKAGEWGKATWLGEWARTSELDGFFVFESVLAEGQWQRGPLALQYRFESTERPEEERVSPYRSARPHLENSILGITRWATHTFGIALDLPFGTGSPSAAVLFEATRGGIRASRAGAFDLAATYGADRFLELSIGFRLRWGSADHVMGKYGIARPAVLHH